MGGPRPVIDGLDVAQDPGAPTPTESNPDDERGVRAALRRPGLARYFAGQAISVTGSWMQIVAIGWLAFDLTGSTVAVGGVTAARTLPILILSLPAGVAGDRLDRRWLIVAASLLGAAAAAALAALAATDRLDLGWLLVLSAIAGVAHAIEVPTFNAFLGQLAGRNVLSAVAINGLVFNAGRIVGPGVGGVLLATAGGAGVFGLNAASYLALAALLATLRVDPAPRPDGTGGGVRVALAHVRADGRLSIVLGLLALHTMTMSIPVVLAAPIAVSLGGAAAGTGVLVSAAGLGAILALATIARLAGRPTRRWLIGAGVVGAGGQIGLAVVDSLAVGALAMAVAGAGMVAFTALSNAVIQLVVPDALRARLMSFYGIVLPGVAPLAALVAGVAAASAGIELTLAGAAVTWLAVLAAATAASSGLREIDHQLDLRHGSTRQV